MPDGHHPATPRATAMDDQFGTHRLLYLIFLKLLNLLLLLGARRRLRMSNSWCCATKSRCCAEPIPSLDWTGRIEWCSPRWSGPRPRCCESFAWSRRTRSCAGKVAWSPRGGRIPPSRRPPVDDTVASLIQRMARENHRWGYQRGLLHCAVKAAESLKSRLVSPDDRLQVRNVRGGCFR
jgi:hypothetical protein